MKKFDIQSIDFNVAKSRAFKYISDPNNLPQWTNAFSSVTKGNAVMQTPEGQVDIELEVRASSEYGSIDWRMTFPDRSVATAFSRIVEIDKEHSIFCFILMPPPVPLEKLEGTLEAQSRILEEELKVLKIILEENE